MLFQLFVLCFQQSGSSLTPCDGATSVRGMFGLDFVWRLCLLGGMDITYAPRGLSSQSDRLQTACMDSFAACFCDLVIPLTTQWLLGVQPLAPLLLANRASSCFPLGF